MNSFIKKTNQKIDKIGLTATIIALCTILASFFGLGWLFEVGIYLFTTVLMVYCFKKDYIYLVFILAVSSLAIGLLSGLYWLAGPGVILGFSILLAFCFMLIFSNKYLS